MPRKAGPRVLLLHGAGGGAWEWNVWRRVFVAAGHAVQCPQLQPAADGLAATCLQDYLDQVAHAATGPGRAPVLIGASLGGLIALALSARLGAPALILVNPMPPAPDAARLPRPAVRAAVVPWARDASLRSTRAALPDADAATWLYAFRRWRDESGRVLDQARQGIAFQVPACPVLVLASHQDEDIPVAGSVALAQRLGADLHTAPGSHVGPLLGVRAAAFARTAVQWLNARVGFRTD